MEIVIFGAHGPAGQILTERALSGRQGIRAVTRHPEAFPACHDEPAVTQGDARDRADMRRVEKLSMRSGHVHEAVAVGTET